MYVVALAVRYMRNASASGTCIHACKMREETREHVRKFRRLQDPFIEIYPAIFLRLRVSEGAERLGGAPRRTLR
eukprot:scaffold8514_cov125-Isochrysis_galbana.AAC.4